MSQPEPTHFLPGDTLNLLCDDGSIDYFIAKRAATVWFPLYRSGEEPIALLREHGIYRTTKAALDKLREVHRKEHEELSKRIPILPETRLVRELDTGRLLGEALVTHLFAPTFRLLTACDRLPRQEEDLDEEAGEG